MPAVFIAERAGLVLHLNRVEIRRVWCIWCVWSIRCIRCIRGVRYILSGRPRLSFGSLSGCVRLGFGCVPRGIRSSPSSISGCICLGLGSVPGCIGGIVVMGIARAFVPGYTTMVSVAAPRTSMTVTVMACSTMIAALSSMAAGTVTATAGATATATATATAVTSTASTAAAILGIHAGETTDVIGHQDSRSRQDSADCQSQ